MAEVSVLSKVLPGSSEVPRSPGQFFSHEQNVQNNQTYSILMIQALSLAQCQAEPLNKPLTACCQLLKTQLLLSFPALFSPP